MTPVQSPSSVVALVATFEAGPISSFGDAGLQALANQIYNQGLADGLAVPAPSTVTSAQVLADLQALQSSDDAAIATLVQKYSTTPPAAPAS